MTLGIYASLLLKCGIHFHNISEIVPAKCFTSQIYAWSGVGSAVQVRFVQIFKLVSFMLRLNTSYAVYNLLV